MSLINQHIFILGAARFDGGQQSTSYNIAVELAKNNNVYYIDYPLTWKDYLTMSGSAQLRHRRRHYLPGSDGLIKTESERLQVLICPPLLSINFLPEGKIYRSLLALNESVIRKRIRNVVLKKNIPNYIYINSFNFHYPGVADGLEPSLRVYHCVDPMIIPYDMKHGLVSEKQLVIKSDLVICTSKALWTEKNQLNPNSYYVPNAADIKHSSLALDPALEVHSCLSEVPKPVIGYAGSIERRLDYKLLKQVVEENPDKSFVFVGPISPEFTPKWFSETANVYLPGRLPFSEIPSLIKGFDVCIIPFKRDEVSNTIFPLKLFEYLGAGKPVVATDFNPDLHEITGGIVTYAYDATSFDKALTAALENENENDKLARIRVAEKNTWQQRGETVAQLLKKHLLDQS